MENRRTPDDDLALSSNLNITGGSTTHGRVSNLPDVLQHSTHNPLPPSDFITQHRNRPSDVQSHQAPPSWFHQSSGPPTQSDAYQPSSRTATSNSSASSSSSMIISASSFYDPAQVSALPDFHDLGAWDTVFDHSISRTAEDASCSAQAAGNTTFQFPGGYAFHRPETQSLQHRQIAPIPRRLGNVRHYDPAGAQSQAQIHPQPIVQEQAEGLERRQAQNLHHQTAQELAHQRTQELLSLEPSYTQSLSKQSHETSSQTAEHSTSFVVAQDHQNNPDAYATSPEYPIQGRDVPSSASVSDHVPTQRGSYPQTTELFYHSTEADVAINVEHVNEPATIYYTAQASQSMPSLHTSGAPSSIHPQTQGHSLSLSPHAPFSRFTPPTHTNTPASDTGTGGYSALSPTGSYQSYPGTTMTSTTRSSIDEGSGSGRANGVSPSGVAAMSGSDSSRVSGVAGSDSSRGYGEVRMGTSDGSRDIGRERVQNQVGEGHERLGGPSHLHSTSVSTVTGSPPQTRGGGIANVQQANVYSAMSSGPGARAGYGAQTDYAAQVTHDRYAFAQQHPQMQAQPYPRATAQEQYQTPLAVQGRANAQVHAQAPARSRPMAQAQTPARAHAGPYPAPSSLVRTSVKRQRPIKRPRVSMSSAVSQAREDILESDDESDDDEPSWPGGGGSSSSGFNFSCGATAGTGESGGPAESGGGAMGQGVPGLPGGRRIGACTHCKRLKMKCEFPEGANACKRCNATGHPCIVEGRKPSRAPNKREYLMAQIRHKDQIIGSLLKQLHNPYIATPLSIDQFKMAISPSDKDNVRIVDWMDRLQSSTRPPGQPSAERIQMIREMCGPAAGHSSLSSVGADVSNAARHTSEDSDNAEDADELTTEEGEAEKVRNALPDVTVPIGLLADLSLDKDTEQEKSRGRIRARPGAGSGPGRSAIKPEDELGVANKDFFKPGPANNPNIRKSLIERHNPPDIVLHGLVTPADVEKLFEIFWKQINPFIGLLDPKLHTATSIFHRCPFLFTVICAISSRYYAEKSEIYPVAMHFAKHSAANALIDGWKSVELCQAYILMSIYAVPARRWEEDRSWLYTGLAVRIATDLNLHQVSLTQPQTERQEREMLNRTRVWMICFNLDRSTATQFGKPSTIKEDYITRNSADWYRQSRYHDPYDIHLCAYSQLVRIVSRFHEEIFSDPYSPTGLNRSLDFLAVTRQHDANLTAYFEEWTTRFQEESDPNDAGCRFRCTLLPFLVNYSRLVMYSFGFQHAFQRGIEAGDNVFLMKCFEAAIGVIKHMIGVLAPSGLMRSSPDGHFIFASFASAFLLKLLRPEFVHILTREMEDDIFDSISRLITTLQDVAIDERHTPNLYARFLAGLLTRHRKGGGGVTGRMQQHPPGSQIAPQPHEQSHATEHGSSSSRVHHAGMYAHRGSEPRYDSDAMQFNLSPPSQATETPLPRSSHGAGDALGGGSGPGSSPESNDVSMSDVPLDPGPLATMHALNEVWWTNMMMPGFSWPDAPLMGCLNDGRPSMNGIPGIHQNYAGLHTPEVQLAT